MVFSLNRQPKNRVDGGVGRVFLGMPMNLTFMTAVVSILVGLMCGSGEVLTLSNLDVTTRVAYCVSKSRNHKMKIPNHLKHKAVIVAEDYDQIDGQYANDTDAKGLSLGLAQWNDRGNVDISAKVWRHTGEKWSRQSEELPLHRVLDLTLLICEAEKHMKNAYRFDKLYAPEHTDIGRIELQGASMSVSINMGNPVIREDIKLFRDCLSREGERIGERLTRLAAVLKELGY